MVVNKVMDVEARTHSIGVVTPLPKSRILNEVIEIGERKEEPRRAILHEGSVSPLFACWSNCQGICCWQSWTRALQVMCSQQN